MTGSTRRVTAKGIFARPATAVRHGQRRGPEHRAELRAEAAAADQDQPVRTLRELVGELQRDAAAEAVADDRGRRVAERHQQIPQDRRVGAQ